MAKSSEKQPEAGADNVVAMDGSQGRLSGVHKAKSTKIEAAAGAVYVLERKAKALGAQLKAARETLVHVLGKSLGYDVAGVDVEKTVRESSWIVTGSLHARKGDG